MPWERDVDARGQVGSASVRRVADGNWAPNRATRDGSLYTADWIQACIIDKTQENFTVTMSRDPPKR